MDLKILGGTIVDGSGAPCYRGDIGIKGGRIVAIGQVPGPAHQTIYATGKIVAPGFVDTEMTESLEGEQRAKIMRRSALGRMVSVEDVANAVEFLLSDKAANITGTVLTVDAGSTA